MLIEVRPDGGLKFIYDDTLRCLMAEGKSEIKRASEVEPTDSGKWTADLSRVGGPILGPFDNRADALSAEVAWLEQNRFGDEKW
jgi:hypothetical protein